MAPSILKKRKTDDAPNSKPPKKARKQAYYSSPSTSSASEAEDSSSFPAVNLADSESDPDAAGTKPTTESPASPAPQTNTPSSSADSESDSDQSPSSEPTDATHTPQSKKPSKRNDPTAFASSIHAILTSKLPPTTRSDPLLSRSTTAALASTSITNQKLESRARSALRQDRQKALEKGRVKDVLLGTDAGENVDAGMWVEEEKRLRKTAQRGVVKLFNAVRQAQVRGEEARREAKGLVGRGRREEKVGEMSRKGFLELVAGGGAAKAPKAMAKAEIEEA